ncbi:MAG: DNA recombination protein RmuC, partial [Candidatus Wallbacteria bacterium]|nr:DNA recombination protein RmuC [Candidatus Wallbacteria bacterium]
GWKQELVAENAKAVSELGRQLYERMNTMAGHLNDIGRGIAKATEAYNKAVGSLETRVLPAARRFKELGAGTDAEIPPLQQVSEAPRAADQD